MFPSTGITISKLKWGEIMVIIKLVEKENIGKFSKSHKRENMQILNIALEPILMDGNIFYVLLTSLRARPGQFWILNPFWAIYSCWVVRPPQQPAHHGLYVTLLVAKTPQDWSLNKIQTNETKWADWLENHVTDQPCNIIIASQTSLLSKYNVLRFSSS